MLSLKQKQSGFTIVELLIVIVIIGILAGLVITTFVGIQARARDSERQTDINAIQKQLEAYYANVGAYPTLADMNASNFRSANTIKLDAKALADPSNSGTQTLGSTAVASLSASTKAYSYLPTPSGCGSSTNDGTTSASFPGASGTAGTPPAGTGSPATPCTGYTVAGWLEAKGAVYSQTNQ